MTYTYTITRLDVIDTTSVTNYVVMAYYDYKGVDGEYSASVQGACKYEVTEGDFTPFEELTQEQVIGWVETSLGAEGIAANQNYVAKEIEKEKNPTPVPHEEPLPWE